MKFKTIIDVTTYFADKQVCKDYLAKMRWNGNVTCPHCDHDKCYTMKHNYKCAKCRKQFSETKGTIFENSPISLQKWFVAIWLFTSHKKGIASTQLAKDIGISQKSAWFVLQRIRYAMETKSFDKSTPKMEGTVQVDESYMGGDIKNMHASKKAKMETTVAQTAKTPVLGIINKQEVRAVKIKDSSREEIQAVMIKEISKEAIVVTDGFKSYSWAKSYFKKHVSVSHNTGQYVKDGFHTNSIEGFWSIFKRGIYGIYHHVSSKHLDRYVNEFEYRYDTRHFTESARFEHFLEAVNGRRLTYQSLLGNA